MIKAAIPDMTYANLEVDDFAATLLGVGEVPLVAVGDGVPVLLGMLHPLSYALPPSRFVPVWLL